MKNANFRNIYEITTNNPFKTLRIYLCFLTSKTDSNHVSVVFEMFVLTQILSCIQFQLLIRIRCANTMWIKMLQLKRKQIMCVQNVAENIKSIYYIGSHNEMEIMLFVLLFLFLVCFSTVNISIAGRGWIWRLS